MTRARWRNYRLEITSRAADSQGQVYRPLAAAVTSLLLLTVGGFELNAQSTLEIMHSTLDYAQGLSRNGFLHDPPLRSTGQLL